MAGYIVMNGGGIKSNVAYHTSMMADEFTPFGTLVLS